MEVLIYFPQVQSIWKTKNKPARRGKSTGTNKDPIHQQCIMHSSTKPCLHRTTSVPYPALEGDRLQHTHDSTLNIHLGPLFPEAIFRTILCTFLCVYL